MTNELRRLLVPQALGLNLFLALGFLGGASRWNLSLWTLFLILLAFVSARNAGHAFNQIVDRGYDALNPRTRERPLVTGELSLRWAYFIVLGSAALLFVAAALLNLLVLALAPVALAISLSYSYTKRFTAWTTVLLGLVESMVPVGVYLAVQDAWTWTAVVAGLAVLFFGTGFETIHSLSDLDSDRELGLRRRPRFLGKKDAIPFAAGMFGISLIFFGFYARLASLGPLFLLCLVGMGFVALWEVSSLRRSTLTLRGAFSANFAFG
ncbi:MAG: UbiA family prenyltransferase, partial [Candidatus Thermoplasmatota archaeon]|nr:UbiA family prenyltransferase [Candidatus Thermoplasmatota archaeon]